MMDGTLRSKPWNFFMECYTSPVLYCSALSIRAQCSGGRKMPPNPRRNNERGRRRNRTVGTKNMKR